MQEVAVMCRAYGIHKMFGFRIFVKNLHQMLTIFCVLKIIMFFSVV